MNHILYLQKETLYEGALWSLVLPVTYPDFGNLCNALHEATAGRPSGELSG